MKLVRQEKKTETKIPTKMRRVSVTKNLESSCITVQIPTYRCCNSSSLDVSHFAGSNELVIDEYDVEKC